MDCCKKINLINIAKKEERLIIDYVVILLPVITNYNVMVTRSFKPQKNILIK